MKRFLFLLHILSFPHSHTHSHVYC